MFLLILPPGGLTARTVAVGNLSGPPRRGLKRPGETGIRAKPQREHRNITEFARNHSGSIETQRNSCETTAGASKPRTRLSARAVAIGNLSDPPRRDLKRPREAGIRAKPQWEHRNILEFARNHSGSIETQWNSCETKWERRNQGPVPFTRAVVVPVPLRAPLRSVANSFTLNVRSSLCKYYLGNSQKMR